jgi:predicted RNA methylase
MPSCRARASTAMNPTLWRVSAYLCVRCAGAGTGGLGLGAGVMGERKVATNVVQACVRARVRACVRDLQLAPSARLRLGLL